MLFAGNRLDPSYKDIGVADVSLSSGVLKVYLGPKYGTYVINKQTPNQQIWLSSPVSGPARFDFCHDTRKWIYKHTNECLHDILNREIQDLILNKSGQDGVHVAGFDQCHLGGGAGN